MDYKLEYDMSNQKPNLKILNRGSNMRRGLNMVGSN